MASARAPEATRRVSGGRPGWRVLLVYMPYPIIRPPEYARVCQAVPKTDNPFHPKREKKRKEKKEKKKKGTALQSGCTPQGARAIAQRPPPLQLSRVVTRWLVSSRRGSRCPTLSSRGQVCPNPARHGPSDYRHYAAPHFHH